jgi:ADP-L-glycero-D-manno-heptose 6-epimerase
MKKILITGGAGFIGSSLIEFLNNQGITDITIINENWHGKWQNLNNLKYTDILNITSKDFFENYSNKQSFDFDAVILMGANSSTISKPSVEVWNSNYVDPVRSLDLLASLARGRNIPIIFASSASVYGAEENDFSERVDNLYPLNFYAFTKLEVDKCIAKNLSNFNSLGINIYSLRFFNVYGGKREIYKGSMQSVISKWVSSKAGLIALYKSSNPRYGDGEQQRDFIHINDICKVIYHIINNGGPSGIYNVGTGEPITYRALATKVYEARGVAPEAHNFVYRYLPPELMGQYQYRTCANIDRLRNVLGYKDPFISIDEGIKLAFQTYNI